MENTENNDLLAELIGLVMDAFDRLEASDTDKSGEDCPEPSVYLNINKMEAWWSAGDKDETDEEVCTDLCFDYSDFENEVRVNNKIEEAVNEAWLYSIMD